MKTVVRFLVAALFLSTPLFSNAQAADADHTLGKDNAPLTITVFSSMTCSHCADFFVKVLPELEKRYIETGKVRLIYKDFPVDGLGLKAAALAGCMPKEQFFPFIKIIYNNQMAWIKTEKPDATLQQYAQMAGLPAEKAKTCIEDTKILDAIIADRKESGDKYGILGTPTFVFNDHETKIVGIRTIDDLAPSVDKALAKKK